MTDAAAYLPDADPFQGYLAQKVENNLRWLDSYAAGHVTPLSTVFEGPSGSGDPMMIAIQRGFAGAQAAYDYLNQIEANQVYLHGVSDLAWRAGWAIQL